MISAVKLPKVKTNDKLTSPYAVSVPFEETASGGDGAGAPPSGYILAGKMKLGESLNVPALNSVISKRSSSASRSTATNSARYDDETLSFILLFKRKFNLASAIQKKKRTVTFRNCLFTSFAGTTTSFFDVLIALKSWKTLGSRV